MQGKIGWIALNIFTIVAHFPSKIYFNFHALFNNVPNIAPKVNVRKKFHYLSVTFALCIIFFQFIFFPFIKKCKSDAL